VVSGERSGEGSSHNGDGVVVEDCGDIFRGELVCGVANEKTCLADRTVADDDAPARGLVSYYWTLSGSQAAESWGGAHTLLLQPPWRDMSVFSAERASVCRRDGVRVEAVFALRAETRQDFRIVCWAGRPR
jgi:hypothetical protein